MLKLIFRAGKDLYQSPEVQKFLNGISTKELQSERVIFQKGSLRKVINHCNCYTINFILGEIRRGRMYSRNKRIK